MPLLAGKAPGKTEGWAAASGSKIILRLVLHRTCYFGLYTSGRRYRRSAPSDTALTRYDEEHVITYLRLLDANADGADWREVSRIVLHIDAEREPDRARRAFTVISLAPDGCRESHIGNCFGGIGGMATALTNRADIGTCVPQRSL
jgi:hypothetical protein